jgi:tetratricopeptide (TPR) repeat protein
MKLLAICFASAVLLGVTGCPNQAHNDAIKLTNDGNKAVSQKQYETAIALFDKAIEKDSDDHLAHYGRGYAYYAKQDFSKAVDDLEKCVQLAPEQPMYQMMYGIALFDKAVDSAKDDQARRANKKKEEIDVDLSAVNFEKAEQHLREAIKLNPDMWRAHYYMGKVYRAQDKAKDAADEFTAAIKGNPREWAPYVALGELYRKWDYTDQAIQVASQGAGAVPGSNESSEIWYVLGMGYDDKKMDDKAIEAFTKAIESKKDNHKAEFQRGQAYFRKGDFSNAKKDLEDFSKTGGASLEFDKQQASKMLMDIAAKAAGAAAPPSDQRKSPEELVNGPKGKGAGGPPPKKK